VAFRELNLEDVKKYSPKDESGNIVTGSDGITRYVLPRSPIVNINSVVSEEFETVFNEDGTASETRLKEDALQKISEELIYNDTRTKFGVNLAVADAKDSLGNSKLSKIRFINGSSGGMQGAIAYIQYWSRSGTTQRVPTSQTVNDTPSTSSLKSTLEEIDRYSNPGAVEPLPELNQDTPEQITETAPVPPSNVPVNPNSRPATGRDELLSRNQNRGRSPVTRRETPQAGKVYSANPGAVPEKSSPDPQTVIPDEQLKGKWQFLFNPEELQLESGPEYNRANTWGVSDPANSGQPLAWRGNKNRKLTFGKVLLTGYVIGKRVDSLESGLQELFMARDGENGTDGPPVLEFIWGARKFGPCVIQNIRVTEKAWDYGILVNAEVSFELEQVPEWTINDGFVDIARPGRQPTVNDPTLPSAPTTDEVGGQEAPGAGAPPPSTQLATIPGGGGGGSRGSKLKEAECKNLAKDFKIWNSLSIDMETKRSETVIAVKRNPLIGQFFDIYKYDPGFPSFLKNRYNGLILKAIKNSFYGRRIRLNDQSAVENICKGGGLDIYSQKFDKSLKELKNSRNIGNYKEKTEEIKKLDSEALLVLIKCSNQVKKLIKGAIDQGCKDFQKK
jgi:hypothetical protein